MLLRMLIIIGETKVQLNPYVRVTDPGCRRSLVQMLETATIHRQPRLEVCHPRPMVFWWRKLLPRNS